MAVLLDPEKLNGDESFSFLIGSSVDFIFLGGSKVEKNNLEDLLVRIKSIVPSTPIVLFPGSNTQISGLADGLLFLSLLSGRNSRFLIEEQMEASERVAQSNLEVIPTAYLLVNDGHLRSVHLSSNTTPILNSDVEQCIKTALAGFFLGMHLTYLDAGSGSPSTVSPEVIKAVKSEIETPLIVGGGLDEVGKCRKAFESGADLIVVGNAIEKNPGFLTEVLHLRDMFNVPLNVN